MIGTRTRVFLATVVALFVAGAVTDTGPLMLGNRDAHAIVGRPLTPVSYAGVARRTTRRTAYTAGAVAAATYPARVTALPAGCVVAGGIYTCGAVRYRPYYDGPNLVYVVVE